MKKSFLFLGALCAISSAFAQDTAAEKATEAITMREGTFWPNFEVQGKIFYDGAFQDPVFDITDQTAIDAAVTNIPNLRSNPPEYSKWVDSLGAAAFLNGSNAAAIRALLGIELANAIFADITTALSGPDWSQADISAWLAESPNLLAGKDLSAIQNFDPTNLNTVGMYGLQGTKLPPMDLSNFTPTMYQIAGADLSLTSGLTLEKIQNLGYFGMDGTKLPIMDLTGWMPSDGALLNTDFSLTTGLTTASFAQLGSEYPFSGAKLPPMDLSGWTPTGNTITQADLTLTSGLTVASFAGLNQNDGLQGVKLPAMDLTGFSPSGDMIRGADLSKTTGLTVNNLAGLTASNGLYGTKLPAMDLTGFTPTQSMVGRADLSKTTGLTPASFLNVADYGLWFTILPPGITEAQLISAGLTPAQRARAIYTP